MISIMGETDCKVLNFWTNIKESPRDKKQIVKLDR